MTTALRTRHRVVAAFLLLVLAAGCLAVFIGVPIAVLWALSNVTDSLVTHFVLGLVGIPAAIIALSPGLFWVNGLYLRVTATEDDEWDDLDDDPPLRASGPLEPMLVASFVVALIALVIWFFFFAENPVLTA